MIPLIPLQFASFKTNLTIEQAIAVLGRSVQLKHEFQDNVEVVSFKYQPLHSIKVGEIGSGMMVYVRYQANLDGTHVRVTIMPTIIMMLLFVYAFGFNLLLTYPNDFSYYSSFILISLIFYLGIWWETVNTKKIVRSLFHDSIIK